MDSKREHGYGGHQRSGKATQPIRNHRQHLLLLLLLLLDSGSSLSLPLPLRRYQCPLASQQEDGEEDGEEDREEDREEEEVEEEGQCQG